MSFNGFATFDKNLRILMETEEFRKADDGEKLNLGYRLLRSKYGLGSFISEVSPLQKGKIILRR